MNSSNSVTMLRYRDVEVYSRDVSPADSGSSIISFYQPDNNNSLLLQAALEKAASKLFSKITALSELFPNRLPTGRLSTDVSASVEWALAVLDLTGGTLLVDNSTTVHSHLLLKDHLRVNHGDAFLYLDAPVINGEAVLEPGDNASEIGEADPLLAKAVERLESFRQLTVNWNGYNAVVPTHGAIDDCLRFARSLPELARAPVAMVSGQGEVGLLWERDTDKAFVEVGFQGDSFYGYLAVMPDGAYDENEGLCVADKRPATLEAALRVFLKG